MTRSTLLVRTAAATVGAAAAAAALVPAGPAAGAAAPAVLRLDGVGPLKLGMTRAAAVRTGWLSGRSTGCPLGGPPVPVVYKLDGRGAPAAVNGTAQFENGRLTVFTFRAGVRTANGTAPGVTTLDQMRARYRRAPYTVKSETSTVFGGRFVRVLRGSAPVIAAFGSKKTVETLGLPFVPTCD